MADRSSKWELSLRKRLGRLGRWLGMDGGPGLGLRDLNRYFEGKSVALVGNARSLSDTAFGPDIDAHAVVVRLNSAPMPSPSSHGSRTDVVATSIVFPRAHFEHLNPTMIWWMTPKPMALPRWMTRSPGYYRYPESEHARLLARLGARPTTGLMAIDVLGALPCGPIGIYGFDFFSSLSLSNDKAAAPAVHDFARERDYVHDLMARDRRFRLVSRQPPPGAALEVPQ